MQVKDSVVVITGASSGIGRATALKFAKRGAAVVLAARREETLAELANECEARGVPAVAVGVDVTDSKAVTELARRAVEQFGRIDVWVNNAAVTMFSPFQQTPMEDFRRVIDVNILGYVYGAQAALAQMRQQGAGVLINVSSIAGIVAQPYTSAYSLSKAAIRSLSTSLRAELQLEGLRKVKVCTILPATIDTPFFRHTANYTGREAVPMPPVYSPQRVARTIVNTVRIPRREVISGSMGRGIVLQHKLAPGLTERMFAKQVDKRHLSRQRPVPDTHGNLFEPSREVRDTEMAGGWGGRRRTVQRNLATAALAIGAVVIIRRLRRA